MPRAFYWILGGVAFGVILALCLAGTIMSQVEQPKYTVVESAGAIEIRQYAPMIVAEVEVKGERTKALNEGFRLIAGYIFGANLSSAHVPMTAPVTQEPGDKIAMTAPVTQEGGGESWKVRFVMPAKYTLETLPRPRDAAVRLLAIPARKVVVIRFSGYNSDKNMSAHREELEQFIAARRLAVVGPPTNAYYNPPWTLAFLRRNEIAFELQ